MRSDGVSETLPREPSEAAGAGEIRRLAYSDLPAVISIERRSFPTPWSLAMFVLELSKPSGICLAATEGDELVGYLVCSRYDQVWHLMNVAVAPERRRAGVARRLISQAGRGGRRQAAVHARGAGLQPAGDRDVRAARLPLGGSASSLLPGQRRGRADHVAGLSDSNSLPSRRPATTPARPCSTAPRDALQRDLLAGRRSRAVRRRRARGRLAPPPRAGGAGGRGGPGRGRRRRSTRSTRSRSPPGPGLIGALLVGVSTAKAIAAPRRLPLIPVDHLQGHVAANFLEPEPLEPPFLCLVASGGHTLLAGVRDHAGYELLGQTLDDAAGEAFDKVARMLGLGYPGGPALETLARGGRSRRPSRCPVAMSRDPGLDFSFSGLKTALVYLCRDLGPEGVEERRADLAASFQAAAVGQLAAKLERALKRGEWEAVALGGGVAANGAAARGGRRALRAPRPAAEAVPIELCTDNAAMIGSAARFAAPIPYPEYLAYDAFPTPKRAAA